MDGREAEIDLAIDAVDHRAGENFAVGEIFMAIAVDPLYAGDAHPDIGAIGGDDVIIVFAVEQIDDPLLPLAHPLSMPRRDRARSSKPAANTKSSYSLQAHFRILRRRLTGELRAASIAAILPPARCMNRSKRSVLRGRRHAHALGIDVAQRLGVFLAPDSDRAIDFLDLEQCQRADVLELLIAGVFVHDFAKFIGAHADVCVSACREDFPKQLDDQRRRAQPVRQMRTSCPGFTPTL